jgi:hypothetical protein
LAEVHRLVEFDNISTNKTLHGAAPQQTTEDIDSEFTFNGKQRVRL